MAPGGQCRRTEVIVRQHDRQARIVWKSRRLPDQCQISSAIGRDKAKWALRRGSGILIVASGRRQPARNMTTDHKVALSRRGECRHAQTDACHQGLDRKRIGDDDGKKTAAPDPNELAHAFHNLTIARSCEEQNRPSRGAIRHPSNLARSTIRSRPQEPSRPSRNIRRRRGVFTRASRCPSLRRSDSVPARRAHS